MIWAVALIVVLPFSLVIMRGSPYLRTLKSHRKTAIELLDLKPGDKFVDLGSGDGAMLLEAASIGCEVVGYEVNPYLCFISKIKLFKYRKHSKVICRDYWGQPIPSDTDALFVFLQDQYMPRLVKKLKNEAPKGLKVASFNFEIPEFKPLELKNSVYLYKIKTSRLNNKQFAKINICKKRRN